MAEPDAEPEPIAHVLVDLRAAAAMTDLGPWLEVPRHRLVRLLDEVEHRRAREAALVEALAEAGKALDEAERRVTLGGRAPAVDRSWANLALPAPASAGVAGAPPLHRRTRDEV